LGGGDFLTTPKTNAILVGYATQGRAGAKSFVFLDMFTLLSILKAEQWVLGS
jgi:hypothetical protein